MYLNAKYTFFCSLKVKVSDSRFRHKKVATQIAERHILADANNRPLVCASGIR